MIVYAWVSFTHLGQVLLDLVQLDVDSFEEGVPAVREALHEAVCQVQKGLLLLGPSLQASQGKCAVDDRVGLQQRPVLVVVEEILLRLMLLLRDRVRL